MFPSQVQEEASIWASICLDWVLGTYEFSAETQEAVFSVIGSMSVACVVYRHSVYKYAHLTMAQGLATQTGRN